MLLFYTYCNLDNATQLGEQLIREINDQLPLHTKELSFLLGNIYFLQNDFRTAKSLYRNVLKLAPRVELEAFTLNNLACTAWYHHRDAMKVQTIPEQTKEKEMAKRDSQHIINYFKETIEKLEKIHNDKHQVKRNVN